MVEQLRESDPKIVNGWSLRGRLGSGGTGVVYKAVNGDGLVAAIKVLRPELIDSPLVRERLRREAEVLKRVKGGRTAVVFEVEADIDTPYIAMELVEGVSLNEFVEKNGSVKGAFAWAMVDALVEALQSIHSAGIIHRDLKPSNIIVGPDGVMVVDFGISVIQDAASSTQTGAMIGTVAWLSPEQITGQRATEQSDVFNLGMVLAYALIGRHPYGEGRPDAVMFRIAHGEPNLDGLPAKFSNLVKSCLTKDPNNRPSLRAVGLILSDVSRGDSSGGDVAKASETLIVDRTMLEESVRSGSKLADAEVISSKVTEVERSTKTDSKHLKIYLALVAILAPIIFFVVRDNQDSDSRSAAVEEQVVSSTSLESITPAEVESNEDPKYKLRESDGKNFRFDPCGGPAFYAINYGTKSDLDNELITEAVTRHMKFVSRTTGLELIFSGATDELPKENSNKPRSSSSAILFAFLEPGEFGTNFLTDKTDSYNAVAVGQTNNPRWNEIGNATVQIVPSKVESTNDLNLTIMQNLLNIFGIDELFIQGASTSNEIAGVRDMGNGFFSPLKQIAEWGPGDILGMKAVGASNGCIG